MDDQQKMRASDRDRQQVVDRLRCALEDGRLTMEEYVDRMEVAYQAATYGDLAPLCSDLPVSPPAMTRPTADARATAPPAAFFLAGYLADLPAVLKVLWVTWLVVVSVNVAVWPWSAGPAATSPTPGRSGWPVRTGRRCSLFQLASRCSGAAGRRVCVRGRSRADRLPYGEYIGGLVLIAYPIGDDDVAVGVVRAQGHDLLVSV